MSARAALIALTVYLLAGCGTSPPTRYYSLNIVSPSSDSRGLSPPIKVRVQPITIPPELDRLELVSHDGPNRVRISGEDRWAAPIDEQIRSVLSGDLTRRLPSQAIVDPAEPATSEPRRLLSVDIEQFEVDTQCAVELRAGWTLQGPETSEHGSEEIKVPARGGCGANTAAVMSQALGLFADRLAAILSAAIATVR